MKTFNVGIVAVAFLLGLTGIGFGIAQAAGTHSEQPVLSFEDQEAAQKASSPAVGMQPGNPIETSGLPSKGDAVLSKVQIDGRTYSERVWKGDIDGH